MDVVVREVLVSQGCEGSREVNLSQGVQRFVHRAEENVEEVAAREIHLGVPPGLDKDAHA